MKKKLFLEILVIFPLLEIIGKKNLIIMKNKKKNWCRNLEFNYCMIRIVRLYCGEQWQRQGAGLGIRRAQGRWGTGARAGALGRAAGAGACGRALGARAWHGQARCRRTDVRASGRRAGQAGARGAAGCGSRRERARSARGWAGLGQCTRCTRPIFDMF